MKRLVILGSTGSIGLTTLQIVRHFPDQFKIVGLAAGGNSDLLEAQALEFDVGKLALWNQNKASELQKKMPGRSVWGGLEGIIQVAADSEADLVVSAISGTQGLQPTVEAIRAGKTVALANKEALVSGGAFVMDLARQHQVQLLPVDSEHSAIFQCLSGEKRSSLSRIFLTASGGAFRNKSSEELEKVTVAQALSHPNWKMGPKVTVDSSTLMNKGLEVIEAFWLFQLSAEQIQVLIHPQSVVHSMVEFQDGSILAQMGVPTMTTPIQYALCYPERLPGTLPPFDWTRYPQLDFSLPDTKRFPCLSLAFEALRLGKSMACYMNAANEVLVHAFIRGEIAWNQIGTGLETLMGSHTLVSVDSLEAILAVDALAREEALAYARLTART